MKNNKKSRLKKSTKVKNNFDISPELRIKKMLATKGLWDYEYDCRKISRYEVLSN